MAELDGGVAVEGVSSVDLRLAPTRASPMSAILPNDINIDKCSSTRSYSPLQNPLEK